MDPKRRDERGGIDRREFLAATAAGALIGAAAGAAGGATPRGPAARAGKVELPPLPWAAEALAPVISAETIGFHWGKHHRAYVDNVNKMVEGTPLAGSTLEQIVVAAAAKADGAALFNNAAQVFNHNLYWQSLKPGGSAPTAAFQARLDAAFGSFAKAKEELAAAAKGQFGSGWAWLIEREGKLAVVKTSNAETPLTAGAKPLLTIDVWEHAYYLDWQNRRPDYVAAVIDKLLDWQAAEKRLTG